MDPYLRNTWYVAGYASDVSDAQPLLARRLLDEPVVFFRDDEGKLCALHDRCPHRFAPLSTGQLHAGQIQCGYHGLRFDASGRCSLNPHGDGTIPKAAQVRAYPVIERHGLIWFWPGDPARADAATIPDHRLLTESPEHGMFCGYLPTACDYQLLVDNILDLTHADFLHPGVLGVGAIARTKPVMTDLDERTLKVGWYSSGDPAVGALDPHLRVPGALTDQWTEVHWTAPGVMRLWFGATLVGEPREAGVEGHAMHLATPESPGRCHYWYVGARAFAVGEQPNKAIHAMVRHAFEHQDKPMLEDQQRRIGNASMDALKPVLLPGDAAGVRTRRKLAALQAAEAEAEAAQR